MSINKYILTGLIFLAGVFANTSVLLACEKSCDATSISILENDMDDCCKGDSEKSSNDCKDCSCCSLSAGLGACFVPSEISILSTDIFLSEIYYCKTYFHLFSNFVWQPPKL